MLTTAMKQKWLDRSRALLSRTMDVLENIILWWEIVRDRTSLEHPNDRILPPTIKEVPENLRFIPRYQNPAYSMVWAGIPADSRTDLIFVPAGAKINAITYQELILNPEVKHAGSNILRRSIHQFPSRLKSVKRNKRGYIEWT